VTSPETQKLKQVLDKISRDVEKLKAGSAAPQLQNSSVEASEGRGYIPIMENGVEKHRVGRQPDGTFTSVSINNLKAPVIPNRPVCTPFIGGVNVSCDGFGSQQYLDFSHINVYVDGVITGTLMKVPEAFPVAPLSPVPHSFALTSVNLSGTESAQSPAVIATPNLVVGDDIANGIIDTLKLKDDAVTAAKIAAAAVTNTEIADGSISTPKLIAQSITTALIATAAINTDLLAAGAITTDKMAANSVTALQIAANAVTAGAIQAGSINATHLTANLILATKIIAGSLTGRRLQLDSSGLTQTDVNGNIALQFGSNPAGNTLTVIDPNNSQNSLATIGADGSGSFTGMSTNGTFTVNGVDLIGFLNSAPGGVQAYGLFGGNSPSTTGEIGIFELSFTCAPNRVYHVISSPIFIVGDLGSIKVRYTGDGTVPNASSPILQEAFGSGIQNTRPPTSASTLPYDQPTSAAPSAPGGVDGHTHIIGGHNHFMDHSHSTYYPLIPATINLLFNTGNASRIRLLFTVTSTYGASTYATSSGALGMQFAVEDIGDFVTATGGTNAGGGTTNATGQYVKTYPALWGRSWNDHLPAGQFYQNDVLYQGYDGTNHWYSQLGFDWNTIINDMQGATINKVEVYLYSNYWANNSGGTVLVGTHNGRTTGGETVYTFWRPTGIVWTEAHMSKPQGSWITLDNSIGNFFKSNTIAGLVLDSRSASNGDAVGANFGTFRNFNFTDATVHPALRITYTK
jgi:hypothetical protein